MEKEKLLVSFSGGRTSAYMMYRIWNEWQDRYDIINVFANTGKEDEGTLEFVRDCSLFWGIPVVWVEATHRDENGAPHSEKGWMAKHRQVDFDSASRKGEPFREMMSLLGIPSSSAPFCSDQLKRKPIEHFLVSIGWEKGTYYKALGIRCDEIDRLHPNWMSKKIIYPLVKYWHTIEIQILDWFRTQPFNLVLTNDDLGNCDVCWKKDHKRLVRIAKNCPKNLEWWQDMTDEFGHMNPRNTDLSPPFNFYRGNLSPADLVKVAQDLSLQLDLFAMEEKLDGCSESCEVDW